MCPPRPRCAALPPRVPVATHSPEGEKARQVTPRSWYAATKMFLESIGYSFSVTHGMSVIVARMGWCPRDERQVAEIGAEKYFQDVYLSPGDAGRFFACAVEAPGDISYSILYPTSRQGGRCGMTFGRPRH